MPTQDNSGTIDALLGTPTTKPFNFSSRLKFRRRLQKWGEAPAEPLRPGISARREPRPSRFEASAGRPPKGQRRVKDMKSAGIEISGAWSIVLSKTNILRLLRDSAKQREGFRCRNAGFAKKSRVSSHNGLVTCAVRVGCSQGRLRPARRGLGSGGLRG